ncbi:MAG: ferredoxin family protein, partial [Candidatus Poribacteria bacterium]
RKVIRKRTGWKVIWGPVYAKDIPAFIGKIPPNPSLQKGEEGKIMKSPEMREVKFPLVQRIEMAIMWAFPFSIIVALITALFWRRMFLPLTVLIWLIPTLIFVSFPLYSKLLRSEKKKPSFSKYTIIFDFGRVPLILWGIFMFCLVIYSILADAFTWGFILRWDFVSFVIILLISIDLMGSTPIYKSGLHEDRFLKVILDEGKCKGVGFCEQVCPRNCYEVDKNRHIATIPRANRCVQCGACIVQCPFDALYFRSPKGEIISPETIRKFKLNLIGKRLVKMNADKNMPPG